MTDPKLIAEARAMLRAETRRLMETEGGVMQTMVLLPAAIATIAQALQRAQDAERLVDRLRLEAQTHAGEARCHKATVHEAYQAVTGATGEPGNWHGAGPIKELAHHAERLAADLDALLPTPLCGESWDLPDTETVSIVVTFGKIKSARTTLTEYRGRKA
jgi:hypothetical protein